MIPSNQIWWGSGSGGSFNYDGLLIGTLGQSNATSRFNIPGNLPAPQQAVLSGVYNWAYNGGTPTFTAYQSGVNDSYGSNIYLPAAAGGVGTWKDFNNIADRFAISNSLGYKLKNTYNTDCYFVPCALGGTALDVLGLGEYQGATWDSNTSQSLFDNAVTQITAAWNASVSDNKNLYPVITWTQGENDAANATMAANYYSNLVTFEADLRTALGSLSSLFLTCPFIVNSLRADSSLTYHDTIQRAQVLFVENTPNAYFQYMFTDRTPLQDGQHYTPITDTYVGQLGAINAGEDLADFVYNLKINPYANDGYNKIVGGDKSISGDYNYYDFKTHGVLQTFIAARPIDNILLLGGGGSGGSGGGTSGGGGGGGEALPYTNYSISVSKKSIYIGAGGIATIDAGGSAYYYGNDGEDTIFDSNTANGGGGGGGYNAPNGRNGGNGGGAGNFPTAGTGGTGTQKNGGSSVIYTAGTGGGGGGASADGVNGTITVAGNGGNGYTWVDGVTYGGGGGGACTIGNTRGLGGTGGGGNGQERDTLLQSSGTDYLGGGGGGISSSTGIGGIGEPTIGGIGRVKFRVKFQN